jgi:hypothetical protein
MSAVRRVTAQEPEHYPGTAYPTPYAQQQKNGKWRVYAWYPGQGLRDVYQRPLAEHQVEAALLAEDKRAFWAMMSVT